MPVYLSLFSLDTDRPGNVGWATSKSSLMDEAWRGKEPLPGLGEGGGRRQQGRDAGMQWGVLRAWLWGPFSFLASISSMEKGAAGAAAEPRSQVLVVPGDSLQSQV